MPIVPQAIRAPAPPVVRLSDELPSPRSSEWYCYVNERLMICTFALVNDNRAAKNRVAAEERDAIVDNVNSGDTALRLNIAEIAVVSIARLCKHSSARRQQHFNTPGPP